MKVLSSLNLERKSAIVFFLSTTCLLNKSVDAVKKLERKKQTDDLILLSQKPIAKTCKHEWIHWYKTLPIKRKWALSIFM